MCCAIERLFEAVKLAYLLLLILILLLLLFRLLGGAQHSALELGPLVCAACSGFVPLTNIDGRQLNKLFGMLRVK